MTIRLRPRRALLALLPLVALTAAATAAVDAQPAAALVDLPFPAGGFRDGVYVPIDEQVLGDGSGGAQVVANGNLAVTWAGSDFAATFDENDELERIDTDLGLHGAITLELSAETAGGLEDTLEVLTVPLTQFVVGPLTVTPYLGVNVRISGQAEAGAQVSVVAPFDVSAAVASLGGRPQGTPTERPAFRPEIGLPDAANALAFRARVEVELTTTFMITVNNLIPIGGPVLTANLGAELNVDTGQQPWWSLDGVAGLKYGWSMPDATTGAPQPADTRRLFPEARFHVDHARDSGPLGDVSTRWSRAFDSFNDDDTGAVLPDGDHVVVVEESGTPWMARLDALGGPSWQHQESTSGRLVEAMAPTADGGFFTAGGVSGGGVRVERFDVAGMPQWAEDVEIDGVQSGRWSSAVATDGGVIVAGNVKYPDGQERAVLIDLDDAGTVRWTTEIDPDARFDDIEITAVDAAPNGDLVVVGKSYFENPDTAHDDWEAVVIRVARNGAVGTTFGIGGPLYDTALGVAMQADGSYAISGQTVGDGYWAWVAAFDASDQLLWSSTYLDRSADELTSEYAYATGLAAVDGDYVVSGITGMEGGQDSWLIRVDGTGMPVWSKSFLGTQDDELTGVVAMPTGVAAFGQTETTDPALNTFGDIWVVRTNVDGMVHFDPASGFDAFNGAVQWQEATTHVVTGLTPTPNVPSVTVAPADFGTNAEVAAAIDLT